MNAIIGDNGIITKAQEAKKLSEKASDEEAIKLMVIENVMNDDETMKVGQELFDRTVENGDKWNIIVEKETGEVYGTGYYYIPKGTKLQNGQEATTNWLVDKDGKMKELKDDTFTKLDYASTVGVTDGLVFNMDPSNLDSNQEKWGDNITLRYFDKEMYSDFEKRKKAYEEQKTYESIEKNDKGYDRIESSNTNEYIDNKNKIFSFNGNNYVEIYNKNGFDFSKGLTFEFYGQIQDNVGALSEDVLIPLFCFWDGKLNPQSGIDSLGFLRMAVSKDNNKIFQNLTGPNGLESFGEFPASDEWQFNQLFPTEVDLSDDIYITVKFEKENNSETGARQVLYVNGAEYCRGWLSNSFYNYFVNDIKNVHFLDLGRCQISLWGGWQYLKGSCYSLRLYNKSLKNDEVQLNYERTKAFRDSIKN